MSRLGYNKAMALKHTYITTKSWWFSLPKPQKKVILILVVLSSVLWYLKAKTSCEAHEILNIGIARHWLREGFGVLLAITIPPLILFVSSIIAKGKNLNKRYWIIYFTSFLYGLGYLITFLPLILFCR